MEGVGRGARQSRRIFVAVAVTSLSLSLSLAVSRERALMASEARISWYEAENGFFYFVPLPSIPKLSLVTIDAFDPVSL